MTEQTSPSRRAGLRDEIAEALEAADYRMDMRRGDLADAVLPVLYRAWPWLRAEAEDAASAEPGTGQTTLRDRIAAAILARIKWATVSEDRPADALTSLLAATEFDLADAVLSVLPAPVDRADVLRDFLWRLEQSAGDAAAEKFLDDNPELRRVAAAASAVVVRRATGETPGEAEPTESVIYEVVGDWGVDSADSAEGARAAVAKWLRAYPKCGAYAQQRIVREWPDGSEFYGPWTDIPATEPAVGAQQAKEA